jgi:hypothetical protein
MATFSDAFAYSNGYLSAVSSAWDAMAGFNDCVVGDAEVRGYAYYSGATVKPGVATFGANHRVGVVLRDLTGGYGGVLVRANAAAGTGVGVYFSAGDAYLSKFSAGGSSEDVITSLGGSSVDDEVELSAVGDDALVYKNGSLIYTAANALVSYPTGQPGLLFYGEEVFVDLFAATDGAAPSAASIAVLVANARRAFF